MIRIIRIIVFTIILLTLVLPSTTALAADDLFIDIPLAALNSDQIVQIESLTGNQNLEFTLPRDWKITDQSWLDLSVTASELLAPSDSSVTISLNGLQLASLQLKDLLGTGHRLPLPPNFFVVGNNVLSFEGRLYLPDDLKTNCRGWEDPARWMYFNPQSDLHIGFQKLPLPADLSSFPDGFLQPLDHYLADGGDRTIFVLPDEIRSDDLDALTATAYFLGHQAGENFAWNPQIITRSGFGRLKNINQNVVFVDNIPPQFENLIANEKNAIGIFSSPWDANRTVMIIFDKDREDGYTPALIFGDWIKRVLLSGNVAYFDRTAEGNPPVFNNKYSFEELGYLDRTVRGIGTGDLIYKIYIPYHVDPTSASLALQIAHNPDLDDKASSISVNLNGYTVASILPAAEDSRLEPIRVDLPTNRFLPGINFVRVSFDLHIPYSSCDRAPESVWATIFNSSTLQLTYQNRSSLPVLRDFPAPFNEYPGVTFVAPDRLDVDTLERVSQLTFMIGASAFYTSQPPRLLTAENYSATNSKGKNYILVGLPSENKAIQEINEYLPQPFKRGTDQLQDGYGVFLPNFDLEAGTGLVQITPSPWHDEGTVLVLTGTNSQGLDQAWMALLDPGVREKFSGNLMVVGQEIETVANAEVPELTNIHFEQTPMVVKIPLIGKFLQQNGQSEEVISLVAIALAGLFTLIALKVAPVLSRLEVRSKKHPEPSGQKRE